jgi:PKD repeat protein
VVFTRKSDATWESRGNWLPGTTDTNWSWNTSAVSTYMDSSGVIGFEWCGCPANANNYDVSSDKMRFRLQLVIVNPPVANFTGNPTSGTAPLTVAFTDTSTNGPTSWSWNFGDGSTSTSQNPSHSYSVGTYTVSLRATNSAGYDDEVKTSYITANPNEVYVYPTSYNWHANGVGTLISGGLSNLQASDNSYMQVRCNASNYNSGLRFDFNTGYTPGQVNKITVEYEFHSTSASQPWYQDLIMKQDGSGSNTGMPGGLWTTTDQWMTWNSTAVSTYMSSGGLVQVTMCGCNQNSTTYDTYVDVVRLKLTLN